MVIVFQIADRKLFTEKRYCGVLPNPNEATEIIDQNRSNVEKNLITNSIIFMVRAGDCELPTWMTSSQTTLIFSQVG